MPRPPPGRDAGAKQLLTYAKLSPAVHSVVPSGPPIMDLILLRICSWVSVARPLVSAYKDFSARVFGASNMPIVMLQSALWDNSKQMTFMELRKADLKNTMIRPTFARDNDARERPKTSDIKRGGNSQHGFLLLQRLSDIPQSSFTVRESQKQAFTVATHELFASTSICYPSKNESVQNITTLNSKQSYSSVFRIPSDLESTKQALEFDNTCRKNVLKFRSVAE